MNIAEEILGYLFSTIGALVPIVNPFATAPMVVAMTMSLSDAERRDQIRRACIYMVGILVAFLVAGGLLMRFFGISVPGLRIAGGLVIAFVGFRMLFPSASTKGPYAEGDGVGKLDIAFSPLAVPSLAGPGSIAVVIGMSTTAQESSHVVLRHGLIALGIVITAWFCFLVLRGATKLGKYLGPHGLNALAGIMGFLLVCIGVQFVINGVSELVKVVAS